MGNIGVHFSSCLGPYLVFSFLTEKKKHFLDQEPLKFQCNRMKFLIRTQKSLSHIQITNDSENTNFQ